MESVTCKVCGKGPFDVEGYFYFLVDGRYICQQDLDPSQEQYQGAHSIYEKNDAVVNQFWIILWILRQLYNGGFVCDAVNHLNQELNKALEMRVKELFGPAGLPAISKEQGVHPAAESNTKSQLPQIQPENPSQIGPADNPTELPVEHKDQNRETEVSVSDQCQHQTAIEGGEAETMVGDTWACRHCNFLNYASNPICYCCRTPRVGEYTPILSTLPPNISALEIFETVKGPSATPWTCPRCSFLNPASKSNCQCGFVNLMMVSSAVQEEPQREVVSSTPYIATNVCWTCSCGYEYNQLANFTCLKCKARKQGVLVGLLESSAPQPIAQEESKRAPSTTPDSTLWTCSCGYEYNLKTSEKCTNCLLLNPFLPPKPQPQPQPPQKCTLCKTRPVNGSTQLCTFCSTTKPIPKTSTNHIYWECIKCNQGFNLLGKPCNRCKKTQEEVFPELKNAPLPKLPEGPVWKCNSCNRRNVITNQKCSGCGASKPIYRCVEGCGTVVESASEVCTDCLKKKEAPNQVILKGRDGVTALYCPSCGGINCKEHAAGEVNPNSS